MGLHGLGVLNYKSNAQSGESHFLEKDLKIICGGVVLDVGASVGDYCAALKRYNPKCSIYAFEPHPATYTKLINNTESLGISALNVGVGFNEGFFTLYDYADNDGSEHASLHRGVIGQIHKGQAVEHKVKVISLDDFVLQHNIEQIALLKIDTEGHEFEVLRGASSLLKAGRIDVIHFEFNEMNVVSRVFFKDIWDFLPNYDFYRMLPDGLAKIKSYSPVFCEIFAYQNIVAKLKARQ